MHGRRRGAVFASLCLSAVLTACGWTTQPASTSGSARGSATPVTVLAAFYPLQFAAQQVGGSRVDVQSLTTGGAEPHDVELSPQQVADVKDADVIVYIKGFQPAIDEAVEQYAPDRALDVSRGIRLLPAGSADPTGDGEAGATDPHIWLDPLNMITIAGSISRRFALLDPTGTAAFRDSEAALTLQLRRLDRRWSTGTRSCESRDLVVSHAAFAYLADRYRFQQIAISGLTPEAEPSPATVAQVVDFVRANDVRTIYYETLVDPKVAQTVADETGTAAAVLDPLEGLPAGASGDYLTIMADNLNTVRTGQGCR
jgi:zinc transport system substrate-binding protein